jgi:hypothetical protein
MRLLPLLEFPHIKNFVGKKKKKNYPLEKEDLSKWFIVSQIRKPSRILNPTDLLTFAAASTSKSDSASEESICQSGDNSKQWWFNDDQMMNRLCESRTDLWITRIKNIDWYIENSFRNGEHKHSLALPSTKKQNLL